MAQANSVWLRWLLYCSVVVVGACILVRILLFGAPEPQTVQPENPTRIAAVGDVACDVSTSITPVQCRQQEVVNQILRKNYDRVLLLGDLQYDDGKPESYERAFKPLWKDLRQKTLSVVGNHEYHTKDAEGYAGYWKDNERILGETKQFYFATNISSWHIVGLNSNCEFVNGCGKESSQYQWFENDLAKNEAICTLAMWHHPRFTSGAYKTKTDSTTRSSDFWQAAYRNGVDVILNGHDHLYERFARQTEAQEQQKRGVRQFTVGTGGRSLYKADKQKERNSEVLIDNSFGYLELDLYKTSYTWRFIDINGVVLDSGSNNCSKVTEAK